MRKWLNSKFLWCFISENSMKQKFIQKKIRLRAKQNPKMSIYKPNTSKNPRSKIKENIDKEKSCVFVKYRVLYLSFADSSWLNFGKQIPSQIDACCSGHFLIHLKIWHVSIELPRDTWRVATFRTSDLESSINSNFKRVG